MLINERPPGSENSGGEDLQCTGPPRQSATSRPGARSARAALLCLAPSGCELPWVMGDCVDREPPKPSNRRHGDRMSGDDEAPTSAPSPSLRGRPAPIIAARSRQVFVRRDMIAKPRFGCREFPSASSKVERFLRPPTRKLLVEPVPRGFRSGPGVNPPTAGKNPPRPRDRSEVLIRAHSMVAPPQAGPNRNRDTGR